MNVKHTGLCFTISFLTACAGASSQSPAGQATDAQHDKTVAANRPRARQLGADVAAEAASIAAVSATVAKSAAAISKTAETNENSLASARIAVAANSVAQQAVKLTGYCSDVIAEEPQESSLSDEHLSWLQDNTSQLIAVADELRLVSRDHITPKPPNDLYAGINSQVEDIHRRAKTLMDTLDSIADRNDKAAHP